MISLKFALALIVMLGLSSVSAQMKLRRSNSARNFMSNYGYGYYYNPVTNPPTWPSWPTWPTQRPTNQPQTSQQTIITPTYQPTNPPTMAPTQRPTYPTYPTNPTNPPTMRPTYPPTQRPTNPPTQRPTYPTYPTNPPTMRPTYPPTQRPTNPPTMRPTNPPTYPTNPPTQRPTYPTNPPTQRPTNPPTYPTYPTNPPTQRPTNPPTMRPTNPPTYPTNPPTQRPTYPTNPPTQRPTYPTNPPTQRPTNPITYQPTQKPTTPNGYGPDGNGNNQVTTNKPENLIYGITFDCSGKQTGFYRDTRYCDIFHVCVNNVQKKTYACPQVGNRFYYDESSRKCEFVSKNPNGCPANNFYQTMSTVRPVTQAPAFNETVPEWKIFVRDNEDFSCENGKIDGFYASRWCNVFYRCFMGKKYEFLCAQQNDGSRTWWSQHSTSQETPLLSAYCEYPCALNKTCTSPGGILMDNTSPITESVQEASRLLENCDANDNGGSTVSGNSDDNVFVLPGENNDCVGAAEAAMVPDSDYCNVFHVCLGGKRKDFRCAKASNKPYDLWWNNETQRCDWPCKVKCSKQIFDDTKDAAAIIALDKDQCPDNNNGNGNMSTVLPGYGKK